MIRRRFAALALLACTIVPAGFMVPTTTAVTPTAAGVEASSIIERFYYSDSSKTEEVGYSIRRCDGSYSLFGLQTAYYTQVIEPCG